MHIKVTSKKKNHQQASTKTIDSLFNSPLIYVWLMESPPLTKMFLSCLLAPCQNESLYDTALMKMCFTYMYMLIFKQITLPNTFRVLHEVYS